MQDSQEQVQYTELPDLQALTASARNMTIEQFDAMIHPILQQIKQNMIDDATNGGQATALRVEIPIMSHERRVYLATESKEISKFVEECKIAKAKCSIIADKKESILMFEMQW